MNFHLRKQEKDPQSRMSSEYVGYYICTILCFNKNCCLISMEVRFFWVFFFFSKLVLTHLNMRCFYWVTVSVYIYIYITHIRTKTWKFEQYIDNLNVVAFTNMHPGAFLQWLFWFQLSCGNKFYLPGKNVLNTVVILFTPSTIIT